jgi:hypothetical protein
MVEVHCSSGNISVMLPKTAPPGGIVFQEKQPPRNRRWCLPVSKAQVQVVGKQCCL